MRYEAFLTDNILRRLWFQNRYLTVPQADQASSQLRDSFMPVLMTPAMQ